MSRSYVITISHQLGCGGAYIGRKLSEILQVPFVDRQILKQTADYLHLPEEDIENREEHVTSFWEKFSRLELFNDPVTAAVAEYFPSDRELFRMESDVIEKIAAQSSAIILGRGGRYILRKFPRHLSILVHADMGERIRRISQMQHVSEDAARRILEKDDRERSAYLRTYTRLELLDSRNYDLCLDTSAVGLDNSVAIIRGALACKLGV